MVMRLLKKSEVSTLKAQERKQEIDQGLALSRRVDNLRETQAEEEKSLQEFRDRTIKQIHTEISEASAVRDTLLNELKELRAEKADGLKIIAERTELLDKRDEELTQYYGIIANKEVELDQELSDAQRLKRGADDDYARARYAKLTAEQLVVDANELKRQAKVELETAQQTNFQAQKLFDTTDQELKSRALVLSKKKQVLDEREEYLDQREVELGNKERAINDKYYALLQAQK